VQLPILSGISPDNWFPDRTRTLRFPKLPTSEGRDPDSKLYDKLQIRSTGSLKISLGIEPFRRFIDRSRVIKFLSFPTLAGIEPSSLPLYAFNFDSCEIFPKDEGMRPDS
jgi:hypothetical protein